MSWVRRHARWLLVGYSIFLAFALLSPSSSAQSGAVSRLSHLLIDAGIPWRVASYQHMELVMNAVIIIPLTFLASLVLPRWTWRDWTAWAFVGACLVEMVQAIVLPGRDGAFSDVVANAVGGLLGALLARALRNRR